MLDLNQVNKTLSSNYILVDTHLKSWSAKKTAKQLAREVEQNHNAVQGAANVGVALLAGVDDKYKALNKAKNALYSYVREQTTTLGPLGNLLPVSKAMTFMAEVKKLKDVYERARDDFLNAYPNLRIVALQNCSTLAQIEDYPEPEDMPDRFSVEVYYLPVPELGSFRNVQLPTDVIDGLAQNMAETQKDALMKGFDDLRKRIANELGRTITQLTKLKEGERTSIFKSMQTSVQNLAGLLEASIPVLGDDPKLSELHGKLMELGKINPESYKKTEHARLQGETLAQEATELLNAINEGHEPAPQAIPAPMATPTPPPVPQAPAAPQAPLAPPPASSQGLDEMLDELDAVL